MTRILLVEDNVMNRELLTRRLERLGFQITAVIDGESGIAAARDDVPDLILMDIDLGMGKMDGWETTRLIKADPELAAIPVIAVTAHSTAEDRRKSFEAGCCEFETKPVDFKRLAGKIHLALVARGTRQPAASTAVSGYLREPTRSLEEALSAREGHVIGL